MAAATARLSGAMPSASTSCGTPLVSVPVLSKTTWSASARRSRAPPSLTMMPCSNRRRAATTWTIGTASPSAQGQVMMRTAMATVMARCASPVRIIQPTKVAKAVTWITGA